MFEEEGYIELGINPPIFCSGVADVRIIDGLLHFTMFVRQQAPHGPERHINLRFIVSERATLDMCKRGAQQLEAARLLEQPGGVLLDIAPMGRA